MEVGAVRVGDVAVLRAGIPGWVGAVNAAGEDEARLLRPSAYPIA